MPCIMNTCSSRVTAFSGAGLKSRMSGMPKTGACSAVMMKKGIHPQWHSEAKVICNGVEVMTVGGTKPVYNVDIYSGNHPFYQGAKSVMVVDEGQLNKFKKRFADLGELLEVGTGGGGPIKMEKPASAGKGKGKKK